ncbi:subclass B1 metallo-beta-lactamase [Algoriphagus aestuariicola]|jgi:metallo-beta-lactamase class B|uniref:beta-lactamase n=1 Tax=Algoriphagus aestuariicola TaxID=1852016 RepID=A0ABS3BJC0_9BACT|nr:subclass B1 metallo-beta-lactamase [Algoriphagus aestuariicola]MBN7799392.1 subclass B1 metallo-beta-lactamase [Algoriphagus aestuariicola]
MKKTFAFILVFLMLSFQLLFPQQAKTVYQSETLVIEQLSPNTFVHISYLSTDDFGKVACNGMLVIDGGEALVFDTPADEEGSAELIAWLEKEQNAKVKGVVATHFHDDCVGGLGAFHAKGIPSYASFKTIELAKAEGNLVPQNGFEEELTLEAGGLSVVNRFFGEGHTRDNVVSYVSSDQVLFGGCLVKELQAGVGFLGDANTAAWSETVVKVKNAFPEVQTVIPGHGKVGDVALLDYTISLFEGR